MGAQTYVDVSLIVGGIGGLVGIVGFIALMIRDRTGR